MAHQYRYTPPTTAAGTPQPTASTSAAYPYGAYYHPGGYTYATPYQAFAWPPTYQYYTPQPQQQQQQAQQQQGQSQQPQQQGAQAAKPATAAPGTAQTATPATTTAATPYTTQAYQTTTAYQTPTTYQAQAYQPQTAYQTQTTYQAPTYQTTPTYSYTPTQTTTYTPQYAAQPQTVPRTTTFTNYTPSYVRESGGGIGRGGRGKQSNLRGLFSKELRNLMYGFGDDRNPSSDTVNVLEEILIEYITDVCQTASASSKKARLSLDDLRKALSRPADAKKLARMEELLFMQEEIKRARAQFESADMEKPAGF